MQHSPRLRPSVPAIFAASLAAILLVGGASAPAQAASSSSAPARPSCAAYVAEAAQRFGVPERWVAAVMHQESGGRIDATSHAGAQGCMQIMPATWAELAARLGLGANPYEPRDNMLAGAAYLRQMYDRYRTVEATLAAYNAGPGRYDDYRLRGRPLPPETLDYIARLGPVVAGMSPGAPTAGAPDAVMTAAAAPIFVRLSGGWPAASPQPNGAGTSATPASSESPFVQSEGLFVTSPTPVLAGDEVQPGSTASADPRTITVASASPSAQTDQPSNSLFVPISSRGHER